jgi:hypothetical protein
MKAVCSPAAHAPLRSHGCAATNINSAGSTPSRLAGETRRPTAVFVLAEAAILIA